VPLTLARLPAAGFEADVSWQFFDVMTTDLASGRVQKKGHNETSKEARFDKSAFPPLAFMEGL
jgi:hypothetical protein